MPCRLAAAALAFSSDARQAADAVRLAGFEGIQFEVITRDLDLTRLSATGRREFARLIRQLDLQLASLRAGAGPNGLGPTADLDRLISHLDRAMETAAGLQAKILCVELGSLPPTESPQAAAALTEIGRRADRHGVVVAIRSELSDFASLRRMLMAAACPWFGVDFDPVAALAETSPLPGLFQTIGPLIRHVRGRDARAGDARRTRPAAIGDGSVPWQNVLKLLDETAFNGWITLDAMEMPDRAAAAIAGLQHLKKIQI